MICIELAAKHLGMNLDGALVVVHGFGNVGLVTAKHLAKKGRKIIAVSDSTSSIDNSKVIDVNAAIDNKAKTGKVRSFPGTEPITNDELLSLKCDVIVPATFEQVIHVGNAEKVKTKLISLLLKEQMVLLQLKQLASYMTRVSSLSRILWLMPAV